MTISSAAMLILTHRRQGFAWVGTAGRATAFLRISAISRWCAYWVHAVQNADSS